MPISGSQSNQFAQWGQLGELATLSKADVPSLPSNVQTISTSTQAVAGFTYTFTASLTLTLPANPLRGDRVGWYDASGTSTSVIAPGFGRRIRSLAENMTLDIEYTSGVLTYVDDTQGWV